MSPDNRPYMSDRLSGIVEAVRGRVEEELRQQLSALTAEHERAVEEALREAARTSEQQAQEAEARWAAQLDETRAGSQQLVASAVTAARADLEAERRTAQASASEWLARVSATLGKAGSLTAILNTLADTVASQASGALLVSRRGTLERWSAQGAGSLSEAWAAAAREAVRTRGVLANASATAVPVLIDRTPVAVLVTSEEEGRGRLEQLALVAASRLATVTATRLVQADRWLSGPGHQAATTTL